MKMIEYYYGADGLPCERKEDAHAAFFSTIDDEGNVVGYSPICPMNGHPMPYIKTHPVPMCNEEIERLKKKWNISDEDIKMFEKKWGL